MRILVLLGALLFTFAVLLGGCAALLGDALSGSLLGSPDAGGGSGPAPLGGGIPSSASAVPASWARVDRAAARSCPGLSWTVLAAIGRVETDFGADTRMSTAGAIGPMQFLPGTFAEYDVPVPPGGADPPSPYDLVDAVYAATRLLCANGAASGADVPGALFSYNHSTAYVSEVLAYATAYAAATPATTTPATTYATTTPTISVPATSPASAAASATTPASAAAAGSVKSWCRERPVRKVERFSELEVRP